MGTNSSIHDCSICCKFEYRSEDNVVKYLITCTDLVVMSCERDGVIAVSEASLGRTSQSDEQ
jgi:hypothetical protein